MLNQYPPAVSSLIRPLPVTVSRPAEQREFFFGFAVQGSPEGLLIQTSTPRPVGYRDDVSFMLPGREEKIRVRAEVVRSMTYHPRKCLSPGMEIRFLDLDPETREVLLDFFQLS